MYRNCLTALKLEILKQTIFQLIRQGDNLAPSIFISFINDFSPYLEMY